MLVASAAIRESQRRGCRVDDDWYRCGKPERGDATRGIPGHRQNFGRFCRVWLAHRGGRCQPTAVDTTCAISDHDDIGAIIASKEESLQDEIWGDADRRRGENGRHGLTR